MAVPHRLTLWILAALAAGVLVGYTCHAAFPAPVDQVRIAGYFSIVSDIFLRLIKMIVAPLVLSTLVAGIAKRGNASLGRIAARTLGWFLGASVVSLLLGVIAVNAFAPGAGVSITPPAADAHALTQTSQPRDLKEFLTHIVPRSIFEAMATNEILQIVVFALFAGVALAALGPRGEPLVRVVDAVVDMMLEITRYVMRAAPLAVFASIAATISTHGIGILLTFGKFVATFYLALGILCAILAAVGYLLLGRWVLTLLRATREPFLLAFATASSEAAYPKLLEQLARVGIPQRISGFVLPLGYSFNLDGSMVYCAFAIVFIAQVYGVDLSIGSQVTMLLLLMVTSKGMAAVPRASLVVVAAALPQLGLPEAGLLLLLGVDQFLDMGRTAMNVVGNSIATAVIARWDGVKLPAPPA